MSNCPRPGYTFIPCPKSILDSRVFKKTSFFYEAFKKSLQFLFISSSVICICFGRKRILFNLPTDRVLEITKGVAWIQFQGMQRLCESEMIFCYQNCSDILWEKKCSSDRGKLLKFEAEGQEFAKFLKSLEQFIQTIKG